MANHFYDYDEFAEKEQENLFRQEDLDFREKTTQRRLPDLSLELLVGIRKACLQVADDLRYQPGDAFGTLKQLRDLLVGIQPKFPANGEDISWLLSYEQSTFQRFHTRDNLADQVISFTEILSQYIEDMLSEERDRLVHELKTARDSLIQDPECLEEVVKNGLYSPVFGEMLAEAIMKARHPDAFME